MLNCQSAPALHWSMMFLASSPSETISPVMPSAPSATVAVTIPTRALVRLSWFASSGTESGISLPARSTTTGYFHPGSFILPPP